MISAGKAPKCVGEKVLVSGVTPFDRENKVEPIKPFTAQACETTNKEYNDFEAKRAKSTYELVVTDTLGKVRTIAAGFWDALNTMAAQESQKSDVVKVEKRKTVGSDREALPPKLAADYQPVGNVSARDAQAYCEAQLDENGKPGRLPTNAERIKMSGGKEGYLFSNSPELQCGEKAQCDASASAVVGSFAANSFGLYDTTGNNWEFTMEPNGDFSYGGGSWLNLNQVNLRADINYGILPDDFDGDFGFRCVWPQ